MIPPRFKNQQLTVEKMRETDILFDTSDPGTGKTRCQLDAIAESSGERATLVLAPKTLLQSAWGNDSDKFTPHLSYSIALANNRADAFDRDVNVYITNTDAATWLATQSPKFFERFERLIIDESPRFKNPTTARSKAIAKIAPYFKYRANLTGTPSPNHVTDLWHQMFILDGGERLGDSFFAFRNVTCDAQKIHGNNVSPYAKKWIARPGIEMQVAQLIADVNIRHVFEECQDIPKNHTTHIRYDLNTKSMDQYKRLKRTAILQLEEGFVLGVNAAALLGKLMQACSGSVYTDSGEIGIVDDQRTNMVVDLVKDRDQSVVFFQWKHQRDTLIKAFKKNKISYCLVDGSVNQRARDQAVARFQMGLYKVFLAQPASTAHGLTLTRGTSTIWTSLGWNLEFYLQGNRRIYRAGQTKKTETIVITANNTVEDQVFDKLTYKDAVQSTVLDILRELS